MIHRDAPYRGTVRIHISSFGLRENCDRSELIGVIQKIKDANRSISSCGITDDRTAVSFASYSLDSSDLRSVVVNYVQKVILKDKA